MMEWPDDLLAQDEVDEALSALDTYEEDEASPLCSVASNPEIYRQEEDNSLEEENSLCSMRAEPEMEETNSLSSTTPDPEMEEDNLLSRIPENEDSLFPMTPESEMEENPLFSMSAVPEVEQGSSLTRVHETPFALVRLHLSGWPRNAAAPKLPPLFVACGLMDGCLKAQFHSGICNGPTDLPSRTHGVSNPPLKPFVTCGLMDGCLKARFHSGTCNGPTDLPSRVRSQPLKPLVTCGLMYGCLKAQFHSGTCNGPTDLPSRTQGVATKRLPQRPIIPGKRPRTQSAVDTSERHGNSKAHGPQHTSNPLSAFISAITADPMARLGGRRRRSSRPRHHSRSAGLGNVRLSHNTQWWSEACKPSLEQDDSYTSEDSSEYEVLHTLSSYNLSHPTTLLRPS